MFRRVGCCASRLVVVVVQPFAPLSIEFRLGAGPFALGALLLLAALVLSFAAAGGLAHVDEDDRGDDDRINPMEDGIIQKLGAEQNGTKKNFQDFLVLFLPKPTVTYIYIAIYYL